MEFSAYTFASDESEFSDLCLPSFFISSLEMLSWVRLLLGLNKLPHLLVGTPQLALHSWSRGCPDAGPWDGCQCEGNRKYLEKIWGCSLLIPLTSHPNQYSSHIRSKH